MTSKSAPTARGTKYVYSFGGGSAEGDGSQKNLLGGKGANLAEMTRMGLPVPPGFIVSTRACNAYLAAGGFAEGMWPQVERSLAKVERLAGNQSFSVTTDNAVAGQDATGDVLTGGTDAQKARLGGPLPGTVVLVRGGDPLHRREAGGPLPRRAGEGLDGCLEDSACNRVDAFGTEKENSLSGSVHSNHLRT